MSHSRRERKIDRDTMTELVTLAAKKTRAEEEDILTQYDSDGDDAAAASVRGRFIVPVPCS